MEVHDGEIGDDRHVKTTQTWDILLRKIVVQREVRHVSILATNFTYVECKQLKAASDGRGGGSRSFEQHLGGSLKISWKHLREFLALSKNFLFVPVCLPACLMILTCCATQPRPT